MGDLTITLKWTEGSRDLDLHCQCPGGQEIYYENKHACGGQLDIDHTSIQPGGSIENIFWEKNVSRLSLNASAVIAMPHASHAVLCPFLRQAPQGRYIVWVKNFSQDVDTPCDVSVAGGGEDTYGRPLVKRFTNVRIPKEGSDRKLRICEFEYLSKTEKVVWHYCKP